MDVNIKDVFIDFFSKHNKMTFGKMFFRLYNPVEDSIIMNYTTEEWNMIFRETAEEDLKELHGCANVVILLWCDTLTNMPHGMLYLQDSYPTPGVVSFHGGTWDHQPVFFHEIFRSLFYMFRFLFNYCSTITTTCGLDNNHADKFQRSFGFIETYQDNNTSYKVLYKEQFEKSIIASRQRIAVFNR